MNNSRIAESSDFAHRVQSEMVQGALGSGSRSHRDLGVKTAPFYVLLGANMPSVSRGGVFSLEPRGCPAPFRFRLLQKIAESIARAIGSYTASLKKVAGVRPGRPHSGVSRYRVSPNPDLCRLTPDPDTVSMNW